MAAALAGPSSLAAAYPSSTVTLVGHGWGHGIGMGQWGSLGYALGQDGGAGNFTYQQILGHYYGGTTLTQTNDGTSMHGGNVIVAMTEVDGGDTIVTAAGGGAVDFPGGSAQAVLFHQLSPGTFQIYTGCIVRGPDVDAGRYRERPGRLGCGRWTGEPVHRRRHHRGPRHPGCAHQFPRSSPAPSTPCRLSSTWRTWRPPSRPRPGRRWVAPDLRASRGGSSRARPRRSPPVPTWRRARSATAATPTPATSSASRIRACDGRLPRRCWPRQTTAGQVMMIDGTSTVATTEYSASSGGYTTGDQFPAVPDAGDAICIPQACNPNHDWTATVPVSSIQAAYPQIGTLTAITVTQRNGLGDLGGRVEQMTIAGTSGTATDTGDGFEAKLGLKSDWFAVSGQPSGGVGGYWLDAADGGVFSFGNARFFGSMGGTPLNRPVVGMSATHDSGGYWEVAADGGIFSFGDAEFHGSVPGVLKPGQTLNQPVVGMATTPDGGGYWIVASDGGVFCFGDAPFEGSVPGVLKPGQSLNRPIVGIVPTRDGRGYWLVASDGGVFAFGDAGFVGSLGSSPPPTPIVGVAPTPDNGGYWLLEADGTAHAFGDAPNVGSRCGVAGPRRHGTAP